MYWQRSILKENGKVSLNNCYWLSFAVSFVAAMLAGGIISIIHSIYSISIFGNSLFNYQRFLAFFRNYGYNPYDDSELFNFSIPYFINLLGQMFGLLLLTTLLSIFIGAAMRVGSCRYYVHKRFNDTRFSNLFSGFQQNWINTVGVTFVTDLFCVLWGLLFIIPGIVKHYQYYYVDFLLADNPNLSGSRARQLSRMLSNQEKGRLFVFDLSFFWWYVLVGITSPLTLGLSYTFLAPYLASSRAELYIFVRDRAINSGALDAAELGLFPQQTPPVC
ncbi:MAG: DUF975 family protein [Oscillospiraceae bacterium]|jgi:hypothetical protein|nr:DUF975 family protein [Oscillospiraceae bacterium]